MFPYLLALAVPAFEGDIRPPWSLAPLTAPGIPPGGEPHPVDRFLALALARKNLAISPEADRATLARRAFLDLTGLLPTPEELGEFLSDKAPGAWDRQVDRLLASPAYGERWGRHWLDVARFAESQGYERDKPRDEAWPYRDWVVRALNTDMPYGEFVRNQVAGDLLPSEIGGDIAATGFLVAGPYDEAGNGANNASVRLKAREDELEDMAGTMGQAFLGLTVHCARCHDHKFDPISLADYHRLKAALAGARHGTRPRASPDLLAKRDAAIQERRLRRERLEARRADVGKMALARLTRPAGDFGYPLPRLRWRFSRGMRDEVSGIRLEAVGGAVAGPEGLVLSGKGACVESGPVPIPLAEKTLEAWTRPTNLEQRGGGVLTVENLKGNVFDSIVLGELEPGIWLAGSEFYSRSKPLGPGGAKPEPGPGRLVHMAISYKKNGEIAVFRDGKPLAAPYNPAPNGMVTHGAGEWRVVAGLRHHGSSGYYAGTIQDLRIHDRALSPAEIEAGWRLGPEGLPPLADAMNASDKARVEEIDKAIAAIDKEKDPPLDQVYAVVSGDPGKAQVLHRGDVDKPRGDAAPTSLPCLPKGFSLKADASDKERRLALAAWLSSPENPVVWRAMANRVWQWHFGAGLSATPSDLGNAGEKPANPALLDHLATTLRDGGGRLKALHRHIMSSRAYRQSSAPVAAGLESDASSRLLWRYHPGRMDAEAVRDNLLHVAGLLDRRMGGPSYRPFLISTFNSTFYHEKLEDNPDLWRRSLYRMQVRSARSNLLDAFDCPDPSVRTAARSVTTTPSQALALMNGDLSLRCAKALAARAAAQAAGVDSQLARLWLLALGRQPDKAAMDRARALAASDGMEAVAWAVLNSASFTRID